jgi:hypothetical protein
MQPSSGGDRRHCAFLGGPDNGLLDLQIVQPIGE